MILTYEAVDAQGRPTKDTVEATDSKDAVEQLRRRGLYVTHVARASSSVIGDKQGAGVRDRPRRLGSRSEPKLPLKTLVVFTRQIAMLLRAGSGIVPAVSAIKRQMSKPGPTALLSEVISDLQEGMRLTDTLRKHPRTFDPVYCAVIAAGEASGNLTEMFDRLAVIVGKRRTMRNKVLGALAYPALLILMSANIFIALLLFVIPRFSDMFVQLGLTPPAPTRIMLATGAALAEHWLAILVSAVALVLGIVVTLRSPQGRQWLSNVQLSVPLLGRLRSRLIQGQVFRTMGMLLESAVGVLDTLELVRASTRNNRFQKLFRDLEEAVTSGGGLSRTFENSGLVEAHICQAIHTGEESGFLGGSMVYCADMLDESNTELIDTIMRLIEPIILIGMGFVVGTVAVSLFLPLFDMTAAMN